MHLQKNWPPFEEQLQEQGKTIPPNGLTHAALSLSLPRPHGSRPLPSISLAFTQ